MKTLTNDDWTVVNTLIQYSFLGLGSEATIEGSDSYMEFEDDFTNMQVIVNNKYLIGYNQETDKYYLQLIIYIPGTQMDPPEEEYNDLATGTKVEVVKAMLKHESNEAVDHAQNRMDAEHEEMMFRKNEIEEDEKRGIIFDN